MQTQLEQSRFLRLDRRREPRYKASQELQITQVLGEKRNLLGTGTLRDISASGACLEMDVPVSVGTVVELGTGNDAVRAVCRHSGIGCKRFVMGFELIEPGKGHDWSPLPATW